MPQHDRIRIGKKIQSLPTENHRSSSCVFADGYVNTEVNKLRLNATLISKNILFNLLEQAREQRKRRRYIPVYPNILITCSRI